MSGEGEGVGGDVSDRKRPEAPGDVDRHLDEMFNRLAGTGAAGRRALAEVEDHLRDAVADELTQGVPARQAERNAVARFGPPARIAGQLRRAHRVASGAVTFSGAWLLIGLAVLMLAVMSLSEFLCNALSCLTIGHRWGCGLGRRCPRR
ncbi:permease prefix domain 1-containing protein [Micromonospora sp. NPDC050695]|uniref:permease prefix domain 1-containing protein n=1 Tax=Micromonospora sp. NPDC050695 TaxID=3154938 RepID=UPI0033F7BF41